MLHFLVVALAGHAKSAPQRRWKMGSEPGESGFKQGHPARQRFSPVLARSSNSYDKRGSSHVRFWPKADIS